MKKFWTKFTNNEDRLETNAHNRLKREFITQSGVKTTAIFSNNSLAFVIALVTLLLQLISFMTTWQGAEVYFGGIFFLAPLFFALAIQLIVYFLSNSLRRRTSILRVMVLGVAIVCSTYFSYIGVYNTVNSPKQYLRDRYLEIYDNLNVVYETHSSQIITNFKDSINEMMNTINSEYASIKAKLTDLESCQGELNKTKSNVSNSIKAPNRNSYANYEDYVKAYNAYSASVSSNSNIEYSDNIDKIISKYGYESKQAFTADLNLYKSKKEALEYSVKNIAMLTGEGNGTDDILMNMNHIRTAVYEALEKEDLNNAEFQKVSTIISELVNVNNTISTDVVRSSDDIVKNLKRLNLQMKEEDQPLMKTYDAINDQLSATLDPSKVLFELKTQLDSEIQVAATKINNIISDPTKKISTQEEDYIIYDMYVLPIKNLTNSKTASMAILCLLLAALIDILTVLFAMILKRDSSILSSKTVSDIQHSGEELFSELVLTSLMFGDEEHQSNKTEVLIQRLYHFINMFKPTKIALEEGYSLYTTYDRVEEYGVLISLLIQMNYIKIVPREYLHELGHQPKEDQESILLLKSKFILWINQKFSRFIELEENVLEKGGDRL